MRTGFTLPTIITIVLLIFLGHSQGIAQRTVLDNYVDSAIANNLVIRQKNISLEKARLAFLIAKSYYLPTTAFEMDYQTAGGGRNIQLPLGDLLNSVYSTLNRLTSSNQFPQLANQSINFLPSNFYDAKVRTSLPLYNPDIRYGKAMAQQEIQLSQLDVAIYEKDLVKNTREAYFNYLLALQAVSIYKEALLLAEEGLRTNQKLLDNGKGLYAYVIRSQSEVQNNKAQISTAEKTARNTALYFNFLLNKDLQSTIDTNYNATAAVANTAPLLGKEYNVTGREEIRSLQQVSLLNQTVLAKNKSAWYPRLSTYLDLGSQASNWEVNGESRYYLLGVQLSVPIYSGQRTRNQVKQTQLDIQNANLAIQQTTQQLSMADIAAKNELSAAIQTLTANQKQLEAAVVYQRLIERGYHEGTNTFIETVDARNQYTQARIAQQAQVYRVLIAANNVERNTADSKTLK